MSTERVIVVPCDDDHAEPLAEFFRSTWDSSTSAASVIAGRAAAATSNRVEPGTVPPGVVALKGQLVLGYVTTLPMLLSVGGRDAGAYWAKGLMVMPEHRNGPVGFAVLRELHRHLVRSGAILAAPAAHRLFVALGYRDLGALSNHLRVLSGGRMLVHVDLELLSRLPSFVRALIRALRAARLARAFGAIACLLMDSIVSLAEWVRSGGRVVVDSRVPTPAQHERLWVLTRDRLSIAVTRDTEAWRARYGDEYTESRPYDSVSAWRDGVLVGRAAVRRPREAGDTRLRGLRVAVLSDLLYAPADAAAGRALLRGAATCARSHGADAILCSTSHAATVGPLRASAYIPVGANLRVLWRDVSGDASGIPDQLSEWWITRGDAESDTAF